MLELFASVGSSTRANPISKQFFSWSLWSSLSIEVSRFGHRTLQTATVEGQEQKKSVIINTVSPPLGNWLATSRLGLPRPRTGCWTGLDWTGPEYRNTRHRVVLRGWHTVRGWRDDRVDPAGGTVKSELTKLFVFQVGVTYCSRTQATP